MVHPNNSLPEISAAAPEEPRARCMLSEKMVLKIVPVGHTTLWRMVKKGQFPKPTFISPNRCFWFEDVVLAWQNEIEGQGRAALRA
jgi:predicted DNA-binding transcriptional regulator AlpA